MSCATRQGLTNLVDFIRCHQLKLTNQLKTKLKLIIIITVMRLKMYLLVHLNLIIEK